MLYKTREIQQISINCSIILDGGISGLKTYVNKFLDSKKMRVYNGHIFLTYKILSISSPIFNDNCIDSSLLVTIIYDLYSIKFENGEIIKSKIFQNSSESENSILTIDIEMFKKYAILDEDLESNITEELFKENDVSYTIVVDDNERGRIGDEIFVKCLRENYFYSKSPINIWAETKNLNLMTKFNCVIFSIKKFNKKISPSVKYLINFLKNRENFLLNIIKKNTQNKKDKIEKFMKLYKKNSEDIKFSAENYDFKLEEVDPTNLEENDSVYVHSFELTKKQKVYLKKNKDDLSLNIYRYVEIEKDLKKNYFDKNESIDDVEFIKKIMKEKNKLIFDIYDIDFEIEFLKNHNLFLENVIRINELF